MNIVIVEDLRDLRTLFSIVLEDVGNVVVVFASATAAELWDGWDDIDVAIIDHSMPGMTGADLCRWLRTEYPNVFTVLTSAHSPSDENQSAGNLFIDKVNLIEGFAEIVIAVKKFKQDIPPWTNR